MTDRTLAERAAYCIATREGRLGSGAHGNIYLDPDHKERVIKATQVAFHKGNGEAPQEDDYTEVKSLDSLDGVPVRSGLAYLALNEARVLDILNDNGVRNIPEYHEHCLLTHGDDAYSCISMGRVQGKPLDGRLKGTAKLPAMTGRALYLRDLATFLEDMRGMQALHGDIKNSSLVGRIRRRKVYGASVVDFELAQIPETYRPFDDDKYLKLKGTSQKNRLGRWVYPEPHGMTRGMVTPELARGDPLMSETDWFQAGLMAYTLFTGRDGRKDLNHILLRGRPREDFMTEVGGVRQIDSAVLRKDLLKEDILNLLDNMVEDGIHPNAIEAVEWTLDPNPEYRRLFPLRQVLGDIASGRITVR